MSQVPNTDNFNLEDVVAAVGSHATVSRDLNDCFLKANASYFDPAYNNNTYAGETTGKSLKRFRNYTPSQSRFYWLSTANAGLYPRDKLWKTSESSGSFSVSPTQGDLIWVFITESGQPGASDWSVFQELAVNLKVTSGYWIADIRVDVFNTIYDTFDWVWFYDVAITSPGPLLSQSNPFPYRANSASYRLAVIVFFKTGSGSVTFLTGTNGSSIALVELPSTTTTTTTRPPTTTTTRPPTTTTTTKPPTTTTTTLTQIDFTIAGSCSNGGTVTISNFTGASSYLMSQQLHTSEANAASGTFVTASSPYSYQNSGNGTWYVALIANDGTGRTKIKSTTVTCEVTTTTPPPTTTLAPPKPWLPSGFSPNGDGIGDYFQPLNLEYYTNNQMFIYNVCGNLMYQTTNYHLSSNWWNGKMKESSRWGTGSCFTIYYTQGSDVPVGNYIWILYINGSEYSNGTVMLAR